MEDDVDDVDDVEERSDAGTGVGAKGRIPPS